jgi:hypothetical protein
MPDADGGGTPPADPPAGPTPDPEPSPKPAAKTDGGAGGKEAVLADLARERDKRQALEAEVKGFKEKLVESEQKTDALAKSILKALGKGEDGDDDPVAALEAEKKKVAATEERARSALLKAAVMGKASELGAHDPESVFAVGSAAALFGQVEVDLEKGSVSDVTAVIDDLLNSKPFLKKAAADPAGGGSPPGSDPDPEKVDKEEVQKMLDLARAGDPQASLWVSKNLGKINQLKKSG